ncbi:TPA: lipoprotein [Providencia alcalifaciens]
MKNIFLVSIFGLLFILTGCDKLTEFTISESQINSYLSTKVKYENNIGITGFADADITLHNLQSEIGRSEPGIIALNGDATVKMNSLLGAAAAADIALTLTARPVFDAQTGSIYLKELKISQYKITPENMETAISVVIPYLNSSLDTFFATQPVYVLNPDNSAAEATAKKLAKGLEIKPGKLVIPMVD